VDWEAQWQPDELGQRIRSLIENPGTYETRHRRKDGAIRDVEITAAGFELEGQTFLYISARDISERKQAEARFRALFDQTHDAVFLLDLEGCHLTVNRRAAEILGYSLEQLQAELREQALRDPLTGLYNRRYLSETLAREVARAKRERGCRSVIVCDVDQFKIIHDTYGHQVGDQFLVEIARLMKRCTRISDLIYRYGGEEFLVVLPGATLAIARQRAEEIRQICGAPLIPREGKELKVTLSLGVAAYPEHGTEAEEIIRKADQAQYQSKKAGRNWVSVGGSASHPCLGGSASHPCLGGSASHPCLGGKEQPSTK